MKKKRGNSSRDSVRKRIRGFSGDFWALCSIAVLYLCLELVFHITCPIKYMTGISCAGCGMSRAWFSLLRGEFAQAFVYHPLCLLPVPLAFLWLFREKVPKSVLRTAAVIAIILFLSVYFFRLSDPRDRIVVFEPEKGMVYRLFLLVQRKVF